MPGHCGRIVTNAHNLLIAPIRERAKMEHERRDQFHRKSKPNPGVIEAKEVSVLFVANSATV